MEDTISFQVNLKLDALDLMPGCFNVFTALAEFGCYGTFVSL